MDGRRFWGLVVLWRVLLEADWISLDSTVSPAARLPCHSPVFGLPYFTFCVLISHVYMDYFASYPPSRVLGGGALRLFLRLLCAQAPLGVACSFVFSRRNGRCLHLCCGPLPRVAVVHSPLRISSPSRSLNSCGPPRFLSWHLADGNS